MTSDFIEAMRLLWRRFRQEEQSIVDTSARYPGRVVRHVPDALGNPTQQVDIVCDDDRFPPDGLTGIPLACPAGLAAVLRRGTRVTLGWLGGDERFPRVFLEWDTGGGPVLLTQNVDQTLIVARTGDAPAGNAALPVLQASGDVSEQHGLLSGPHPSVSAGVGVPTFTGGSDQMFSVSVVLASQESAGATLFTANFGRAYTGTYVFAVASCDSGFVSVTASTSGVTVIVGGNDYSGGFVMDAGTYHVTVFTKGSLA